MSSDGSDGLTPEIPLEREGQYTRLEELGRGAQSVVVRAFDQFMTREVALKEMVSPRGGESGSEVPDTVPPSPSTEPTAAKRRRFLREAQLISRLDHPGIVSVHELARRPDGTIFCAQKLVRGETLKKRLVRCISLSERLHLLPHLIAACQAVAYAHSQQVIHRDLKPSNIMVGPFGETVVVDWGLAKLRTELDGPFPTALPSAEPGLTVAGAALGTPEYMSPEQARGDLPAVDARSDVFSLGAILYEVLAGRPPFAGATPEHVLENARAGKLHPVKTLAPHAPPELLAIVDRALRTTPAERYPDAGDLAKELSAYIAGGRVRAYEYGTWELFRKFASSHRALLAGVGIALGALLVSAVVVATRLHLTRIDLARSFLERAYRAEQDGDWSRAAAYFAAARAQRDTIEERWGEAIASQRITERILAKQGPAESYIDVAVLPDGRAITLDRTSNQIEVKEAESGRTLWTRSADAVLAAEFHDQGMLRLSRPDGWTFHEGATGRELAMWPRSRGDPCTGVFPPTVAILGVRVLSYVEGAEPRVLATDALETGKCSVSSDRRQLAYDRKNGLHFVSIDDGRELARPGSDPVRGFFFSRHGLIILRYTRIEILGGAEGDFTIELPEARFGGWSRTPGLGGTAVSPDGELVAVASRSGGTQAAVVDLRSRSIRGILHYPPGWPRMAFSPDGGRVFASGLNNRSVLSGWKLPPDDTPRKPRWWTHGGLSADGRSALQFNILSGRYELFRPATTLVASGTYPLTTGTRLDAEGRAAALIAADGNSTVLVDLEKNRTVWQRPCRLCTDLSISEDGSRLSQVGADGLEVWDSRTGERLFQETRRVRSAENGDTTTAMSPDGLRIAWNFVDTTFVRVLDSRAELAFPLDGPVRDLVFSPDGKHLLSITTGSMTLRDSTTGRILWSTPNELPDVVATPVWSPDGRAVVVTHGFLATEVLDTRTGERIAWFQMLSGAVTPVRAEIYSADLRLKAVAGATTWDIVPMPQPDQTPADEALARTLRKTGLEFRGVELIAAPVGP